MAFAELRKPSPHPADQGLSSRALYQHLETLLVSGGDARLSLLRPAQHNVYGCTPFPRPDLLDFASSTASGISGAGYARAEKARANLLFDAASRDLEHAFDRQVEDARAELRGYFGVAGTEIVFSPSGTDAQLQILFLARSLAQAPLTVIIAGSDQTGRGTTHTARGRHFSSCTAQDIPVVEGAGLAGFDGLRTVEIAFRGEDGALRSEAQMDALVTRAVETAIAGGAKILLQALESSKLGWRAPSDACLAAIAARWPDDVRIVIDACQMRLGASRLRGYLDRGFAVLATGSKFFTGPAFSGALLIPPGLARAIDSVTEVPPGLCDYSNRFDWPRRWPLLRAAFPATPNYGQWLRWEVALEEMRRYFEVPATFRDAVLGEFADVMPRMIAASGNLNLLPEREETGDDEMRHRTIFAFVPHRSGLPLTLEECTGLYRALGRALPGVPVQDRKIANRLVQLGQPVALGPGQGAALRLCASARLVSSCWRSDAIEAEIANAAAAIEKLEWLIAHPGYAS
jgi:hypothetical protein